MVPVLCISFSRDPSKFLTDLSDLCYPLHGSNSADLLSRVVIRLYSGL